MVPSPTALTTGPLAPKRRVGIFNEGDMFCEKLYDSETEVVLKQGGKNREDGTYIL